jgi:hypothetical protein
MPRLCCPGTINMRYGPELLLHVQMHGSTACNSCPVYQKQVQLQRWALESMQAKHACKKPWPTTGVVCNPALEVLTAATPT